MRKADEKNLNRGIAILILLILAGGRGSASGRPPAGMNAGSGDVHRASGCSTEKEVVVVLGSSTAAGVGAVPADSAWVNRYRSYLQYYTPDLDVINLAVGGITTYQIMPDGFVPPSRRFTPLEYHNITQAVRLHPKAIIINLPSNDAANYFSIAEQIANFDTLAGYASRYQIPFWFSTTQPRNFRDPRQRDALKVMRDSILSRYSNGIWTHALDFWSGLADSTGNILPAYDCGDHIHLNNAGHHLLFERVVHAHVLLYTPIHPRAGAPLAEFRLYPNFPNPFNTTTILRFELAREGPLRVTVLDLTGREVTRLCDGPICAGPHDLIWKAAGCPSGLYLVWFQSRDVNRMQSITLVR
ncbi:MAG TPA: SGNH/GDSL hydrolase family protein [bacterium]|nr:SGNH/GDSL hydrolase family protein [bacterium]HQG45981.1 SGNH/GDSL hydrolase family protein [bacterium]HQI47957.1 SGNH/GDSL hydrolase family protein [bacterium]HQJ64634.1 SGNH/GDSL hydrolase family protein [bacterium]